MSSLKKTLQSLYRSPQSEKVRPAIAYVLQNNRPPRSEEPDAVDLINDAAHSIEHGNLAEGLREIREAYRAAVNPKKLKNATYQARAEAVRLHRQERKA